MSPLVIIDRWRRGKEVVRLYGLAWSEKQWKHPFFKNLERTYRRLNRLSGDQLTYENGP
jgi:hypothetical protein